MRRRGGVARTCIILLYRYLAQNDHLRDTRFGVSA
jgi:hypothetical protein